MDKRTRVEEESVIGRIVGFVLGALIVLAAIFLVNALIAAPVRWCEGINPKTGVKECRQLRDMMGEKQCPAGYVEVPACTIPSGTVEVTPVPTEPPDVSEVPTPGPTPTLPPGTLASNPLTFSMPLSLPLVVTLPNTGYEIELYCAPRACWIEATEPNWVLRGPFRVTVRVQQ